MHLVSDAPEGLTIAGDRSLATPRVHGQRVGFPSPPQGAEGDWNNLTCNFPTRRPGESPSPSPLGGAGDPQAQSRRRREGRPGRREAVALELGTCISPVLELGQDVSATHHTPGANWNRSGEPRSENRSNSPRSGAVVGYSPRSLLELTTTAPRHPSHCCRTGRDWRGAPPGFAHAPRTTPGTKPPSRAESRGGAPRGCCPRRSMSGERGLGPVRPMQSLQAGPGVTLPLPIASGSLVNRIMQECIGF